MRRWLGPLAVAAVGLGVAAGGIWYRVDVPVVQVAGPASTQTVSLPPRTATETQTQVETVRLTPKPAPAKLEVVTPGSGETVRLTPEQTPAKREVIAQVREAKPETVVETVTKTRAGDETETETETETERVLQVDVMRPGKGRKDGE